jgi:hypothetical protein
MATISHSYAEKILAEHPTSIHIFDDELINSTSITLKNFDSSLSASSGKILRSVNTAKDLGFVTSSVTITKTAPIVHGSEYSVYLSGSTNAVTIPSQGILTYNGRYNTNTLEFWTKIDKPYSGKRKIVGAFSATDDGNGLYVNQTSFILKIGNKSGTAYIKDFNRPFLIQISNTSHSATLTVNGEILISLSLADSDLAMLTNTKYLSFGQGTYDCISTYSYQIDAKQATIHFGYGHGISFPDNVVRSFDGQSVVVDYSKSKYASNYNYTTNASWKQSKTDNINVENTHISNFQYSKPTLNSDTKTITDLESTISGTTFNLKTGTMSTAISNLQVDALNIMNQPTKAFYMHGYYTTLPTSEQILFKVVNKKTRDYFSISVARISSVTYVYYKLKYQATSETAVLTFNNPASNFQLYNSKYNFIVGIDIDKFAAYCTTNNSGGLGTNVQDFFANQSDLIMYVGGDDDLTSSKTCSAEIYSVKLLTQENLNRRSTLVFSSGVFQYPSAINTSPSGTEATQNNIVGSYDIRPYQDLLEYTSTGRRLSVATQGYWKNDIPLTQFCKTVKDSGGNDTYTYNFVQFNIDYESSLLSKTVSSKKYFDTTNYESSDVKTYVTFEPLNATYQADSVFTTIVDAPSDRTVIPGAGWATTKYEVVDGFIIYPPTGIDLKEYTMVVHADFSVVDTENNLINIQKMQLASQAYNANSSNPIGTKYGTKIIPYTYTISGASRVYDYSAYNPFLINKKDNPYLYMARDSGIRLVGFDTTTAGVYRGIKIPINSELKSSFNISIMQLSIFYNAELDTSSSPFYAKFPYSSEQIFEIKTNTRTIQFFLTRTGNGDTATISALSNSITNENISYYLNGQYNSAPSISTNQWYTLGIVFTDPLIFNSTEGEFDLVGGISIDNLSYYQFDSVKIAQNTFPVTWNSQKAYTWSYLANNYVWGELSILTAISPSDMSSMFTGTNRITGNNDIANNFGISSNQYKYFADLNSQIITASAT